MKNLTLKGRFKIQIIVGIFSLLIIMFGVRLMGKVTDFAYFERMHILYIKYIETELSKERVERKILLNHVSKAREQPVKVHESIFGIEKLFFRLLGQGYILDLAAKDIKELTKIIEFLDRIETDNLTSQQRNIVDQLMQWPSENTEVFGAGLRGAAAFTKNTVILLVATMLLSSIALLIGMMQSTLPPLQRIASTIKEIAEGNLDVNVEHSESAEMGHMQLSTIKMIESLRHTVLRISQAAQTLSDETQKASAITEDTLHGVQTQKKETELLTTSISEMSIAIDDVAKSAANASNAAHEGSASATKGKRVISEAAEAIHSLVDKVNRSAKAIQKIEADTQNIGSVLEMIQGITEQTNLLALNAAIEAARAGEHGRGFAVVAAEVRTLAQRTQDATKEIQATIEGLQSNTQSAVNIMEDSRAQADISVEKAGQATKVIEEIVNSVSSIVAMNQQIAAAAEEQSVVTAEIRNNTVTISEVAEQTAVGGEKTAETNNALVLLSRELGSLVSSFKLEKKCEAIPDLVCLNKSSPYY